MLFFLAGVVVCVTLTIKFGWSAKQISSWFLGLAVIVGIISGFSMNEIAKKFIKGCGPMVSASFVVGIASAVALILSQGQVMDTIVNALSQPLAQMGSVLGAGFMVVINALINILIPSGSGPGSGGNASYGSDGGPGGNHPSGSGTGLPVWRWLKQPCHTVKWSFDGMLGNCRRQLPEVF